MKMALYRFYADYTDASGDLLTMTLLAPTRRHGLRQARRALRSRERLDGVTARPDMRVTDDGAHTAIGADTPLPRRVLQ